MKTHKDLDVWKDSIRLVQEVYLATDTFPKSEMHSLTNQIRRAAVSIPANISEGSARRTTGEYRYFLSVAFASLNELETLLIVSARLGFMSQAELGKLTPLIIKITSQLSGLKKALDARIKASATRE